MQKKPLVKKKPVLNVKTLKTLTREDLKTVVGATTGRRCCYIPWPPPGY